MYSTDSHLETHEERDANRQAWQHGLAALMDIVDQG